MASAGPNSPGAASTDSAIGLIDWTNASSVSASDNTYAAAAIHAGAGSYHLVANTFGFSIPDDSIIDGIVVEVERKQSGPSGSITDFQIKIVKGGVIGSEDKASAANWPESDTYTTYGGSSDLWGESWTASDINASSFGVAVSAINASFKVSGTASIDHVRITVYYTEGTTTTTTTTTTPAPSSTPRRHSVSLASGIRL